MKQNQKRYRFPFRTLFVTKPLLFKFLYDEFVSNDYQLQIHQAKQNKTYIDYNQLYFFSPALFMCQYLKQHALRTAILSDCDERTYSALIQPTLCQHSIKSYIEPNEQLHPLQINEGGVQRRLELNESALTEQMNGRLQLHNKEFERIHAVIFDGPSLQYKQRLFDTLFQAKQYSKPSIVIIDKPLWVIDKAFCRDFLSAGHG